MVKRKYPHTRLRRTRAKAFLRDLVAEKKLSTDDLIQPIFIADQKDSKVSIPSMPGIYRHNLESLYSEVESLINLGIKSIAIFPAIDPEKKDAKASHAFEASAVQLALPCGAIAARSQKQAQDTLQASNVPLQGPTPL